MIRRAFLQVLGLAPFVKPEEPKPQQSVEELHAMWNGTTVAEVERRKLEYNRGYNHRVYEERVERNHNCVKAFKTLEAAGFSWLEMEKVRKDIMKKKPETADHYKRFSLHFWERTGVLDESPVRNIR